MNGYEFGRRLRQEREAQGLTQEGLGMVLAEASATYLEEPITNVSAVSISHWEGGQVPRRKHALLICLALQAPPEFLALEALLPDVEVRRLFLSAPCRRVIRSTHEVFTARRRAPAGNGRPAGDLPADAPVQDLERLARAMYGAGEVDAVAALDMRAVTDGLIHQRGRIGNRLLLVKLHEHLGLLRDAMERTRSSRVRRELVHTAATTAVVAANTWNWANDFGAARQVVVHARELAREGGAGVVGAMADMADSFLFRNRLHREGEGLDGGPGDAVEVLRRAERSLAGGVDPHFSAILCATRAWNYAAAGHELEAERDFEAAARALATWERLPDGWFTGFDATYLDVCRAKAAVMLDPPRPERAAVHLEQALAATRGWMVPTYQILLASAYAQAGRPDQAAALLMETVNGARSTGATLLLTRIDAVLRRDLVRYGDVAAVKQLREAVAGAPVAAAAG
jgi:transcriptional regulator with XRE-family HTH domain